MRERRSSSDTEQALVARANAGEKSALEQLYNDYRDWVTAVAYRLTGSRDDALDVLQETYIYLFSKFPGFRLTSSIRSFLYPVVKHRSISVLRKRQRIVALDAYRDGPTEVALVWLPPAGTNSHLQGLVAGLPPGQREVVRLRFGLEFRLDEIAHALAIPLGTVKSRLHNALKSLRSDVERAERRNEGAGS